LQALRIHNGTVYRWNRACFGFSDGKPHLRIENRVLPAGPTVIDEVANAAFLLGLLSGGPAVYEDITRKLAFHDAESNFLTAAQVGLDAQLTPRRPMSFLPQVDSSGIIAYRSGRIAERGPCQFDNDRYLDVIAERVSSGQTGSQWLLHSLTDMHNGGDRDSAVSPRNRRNRNSTMGGVSPCIQWSVARIEEGHAKHCMTCASKSS
jgi:hypothetical protein